MTVCLNNPVLGREITDNFTFDDTNNQIVPKPGTDTKPGALALNLGNNLPGDTTNATDALTASGFNAMANAVDTTEPLCGNEIQQAVTAAVAQSIGCDADAQEAIACAIANNPDAIACLAAALPSSGGCDDTGSLLLDAAVPGGLTVIDWTDGVATQLTSPLFTAAGTTFSTLENTRHQNPGNFTNSISPNISDKIVSLDTTTLVYGTGTRPEVAAQGLVINHPGTRLAYLATTPGFPQTLNVFDIGADGKTLTQIMSRVNTTVPQVWAANDILLVGGEPLNVVTNTFGTSTLNGFDPAPLPVCTRASAISNDYSKAAEFNSNTGQLKIWSIARTGDDVVFTLQHTQTFPDLAFPALLNTLNTSTGISWTPDNSQIIVATGGKYPDPLISDKVVVGRSGVVNVSAGGISIEPSGVMVSGTSINMRRPLVSADGQIMIMSTNDARTGGVAGTPGTAIFKKDGSRWRQIGHVPSTDATIVGGVAGYSRTTCSI